MIPATLEQLRTLRGIVYGILNRRNGRWYIGQSIRSFWKRYYRRREWWKFTHNECLRRAVVRYGSDSFEIYILEHDIVSLDLLNQLEKAYIRSFNALYPNGYNFATGGDNQTWTAAARDKKAKSYRVKDINGVIYNVRNGTAFCRQHNLNTGDFWRMLRGKQMFVKGFSLVETPSMRRWAKRRQPLIELEHQDGRIIQTYNLTAFAREHQVNARGLAAMVAGNTKVCGGWFLAHTRPIPVDLSKKRWRRLHLTKDGQEIVVENSAAFGRQTGIKASTIWGAIDRIRKTGKPTPLRGFRLEKVEWL